MQSTDKNFKTYLILQRKNVFWFFAFPVLHVFINYQWVIKTGVILLVHTTCIWKKNV